MNSNQLEKYLRNRILVEIRANSLRKQLTEDQIGDIAIYLASDDNLLTEGFFSTIGALLGGGMTETKRFLAKRVVSFLGIPSGHPLSQPVTDFIARLPTKDIYAMYRGNPRMRKKLVSVLSDATVNAFKQEMPNIMALKGGSLGGPITDAMVDVVSTKEFKQSVKKSFEDALVNLPGSDAGDLETIKQDIEDLKKGVADITQGLKQQASPDKEAAPEAPDEMPVSTKDKVKATDPLDSDTENDGLPDGKEDEIGTDPTSADTDGDGLPDGDEVEGTKSEPAGEQEATGEEDTAPEALNSKQIIAKMKEFIKTVTGGKLGIAPSKGQKGISWFSLKSKSDYIDPIYAEFVKATTDEEKIRALRTGDVPYITDAGLAHIEGLRKDPEDALEDAESAEASGNQAAAAGATTAAAVGGAEGAVEAAKKAVEAAAEDPAVEAPDPETPPEEVIDLEEEPLSDDELNRVLKNVVRGYSKYSEDKSKALTDKRLLRNLSELAAKLKSEEGYEEYPKLIDTMLNKKSSGTAKERATRKLIDEGGIDKIIAKASEVLGVAQAAPEVEAEPTPEPEVEAPAPEATPEPEDPEPAVAPEVEAAPEAAPEQEPEPEISEPTVDSVPPEAREQYKSLEKRLNFSNLSDEEEEAISQQLEDLENRYPGVDQEPEAAPVAVAPQTAAPAPEPQVVKRPTSAKARTAAAQNAEAEAAVEDTEADAADAKADDLERAAENEPENKRLQKQATSARAEADRERVQADKAAKKAKSSSKETVEYEVSLDPKANSERDKLLQAISEVHPDGNMDLYKTNLNKYLDVQIDRFYEEGAKKASKSKAVADGKKSEQQFIDEYTNKQIVKLLKQLSSDIKQSGSTAGRSYIFGAAAQEEGSDKEESSQGFRQINVELYDDKTVVLSDRSMRGKLKRPTIGEGIVSEVEWSTKASKGGPTRFDRIGVSAVELPAISIDDIAKANWKTTSSSLKALLLDRIKILLMNSPDETKEVFDIENLVIMPAASQSGQQISGIIDNRKSKEVTVDMDYTSPRGISGRKLNDYLQGIIKNTVVEGKVKEDRLMPFSKKLAKSAIRRKAFIDLIEYFKDNGQYEGEVPEEEDFTFDDRGTLTASYIRELLTGLGLATARKQDTEDDIEDLEADVERQMQASLKSRAKEEVNEEISVEEVFSISEEQLRRLLS